MPSGSQLFQSDSDASLASSVATISIRAVSAASAQQAQDFRALTRAYLEWLGEDLGFQGIERELASLPGSYAADQGGHMLLAYECAAGGGGEEECVGAVALRRLAGHTDTLQPGQAVARVPLEKVGAEWWLFAGLPPRCQWPQRVKTPAFQHQRLNCKRGPSLPNAVGTLLTGQPALLLRRCAR